MPHPPRTFPPAEMALSLLMNMAALPRVQHAAAGSGYLAALVCALQDSAGAAPRRLQAVLLLCRLARFSPECQLACLKVSDLGGTLECQLACLHVTDLGGTPE